MQFVPSCESTDPYLPSIGSFGFADTVRATEAANLSLTQAPEMLQVAT